MGADPARITAADFVTPPEFRGLTLSANEAGRVGGLRLELVAGERGTDLGSCYQQVPLRVLPPFRLGEHRPALLYLLNPTAGLLDGDGHLVHITARSGTRAVVVGQSATRIHPCPAGFATQQWAVRVEAGAVLAVLPGPSIPFEGCRYYQRVEVELDEGAGFAWGDVGLAGRHARGAASERFRFAALVQECHVRRRGRLVFRDRLAWHGPWDEATAAWHFGGGSAWGSVFATGPASDTGGARFTTAHGDTCVRWTGVGERVTAEVVRTVLRRAAGGGTFGDELAPVHWFSVVYRRVGYLPVTHPPRKGQNI
jgi:urease accessory protein